MTPKIARLRQLLVLSILAVGLLGIVAVWAQPKIDAWLFWKDILTEKIESIGEGDLEVTGILDNGTELKIYIKVNSIDHYTEAKNLDFWTSIFKVADQRGRNIVIVQLLEAYEENPSVILVYCNLRYKNCSVTDLGNY